MKILDKIAGDFDPVPDIKTLNSDAQDMIMAAMDGLAGKICDYHVHLIGKGTGETGCEINPKFFSLLHPANKLKYEMYLSAAGVHDEERTDQQYVERFDQLFKSLPGQMKFAMLALDKCYNENGTINQTDSSFYVPNEYLMRICSAYPGQAIPCISIHPYRLDAIVELEFWAKQGVKMVKWLPNSMGIDPSHELCAPFYAKMKEHHMVLLAHAGQEDAVQVTKFNPFGNPLLLRKALEMGVMVVIAHCASSGQNPDLDRPGKEKTDNFLLFLRLMDEDAYKNNLFGDISGITQVNRCHKPLRTLLERQDLHPRLINGSDYPLPGVNASISTLLLHKLGYIEKNAQEPLKDIYHFNPLLFDFVLKRQLKHFKNNDWMFDKSVFKINDKLGLKPFKGEFRTEPRVKIEEPRTEIQEPGVRDRKIYKEGSAQDLSPESLPIDVEVKRDLK